MKVLVVDDDDGIRDSLTCFLDSEGHHCQTARNGLEALEALDNYTPDVVVADINMPQMSGVELIKHIRCDHPNKKIAVILITGGNNNGDVSPQTVGGPATIIKKPIHASELREFLSSI